jgi:hypothetical protein
MTSARWGQNIQQWAQRVPSRWPNSRCAPWLLHLLLILEGAVPIASSRTACQALSHPWLLDLRA